MRVLVVADNCTDATADLARAAGVEVIERNDLRPAREGLRAGLRCGSSAVATRPMSSSCSTPTARSTRAACRLWSMLRAHRAGRRRRSTCLRPDRDASPLVQLSTFRLHAEESRPPARPSAAGGPGAPDRDGHGDAVRAVPMRRRTCDRASSRISRWARPCRRGASADARHERLRLEREQHRSRGRSSSAGDGKAASCRPRCGRGPQEVWHGLVRGKPRASLPGWT